MYEWTGGKRLTRRATRTLEKAKNCPDCFSCRHLWAVRVVTAPFGMHPNLPQQWWIECAECHFCGPTKWGLKRAVMAWNKEEGSYNSLTRTEE